VPIKGLRFFHRQIVRKIKGQRGMVAHICNPSCSGGRDQEDRGSKPAQAKMFKRPYVKKKPTQVVE
jgi:hypothetical protein